MGIYSDFISTVSTGVKNPYGLAAVAATGKHESGYSPSNAYGSWSDPSERGQAGTAGGIMSWRGERLQGLQQFAADNGDDPNAPSPATQAAYFLQEDPNLVAGLNSARSVEEAQSLMNRAWRFAGYDRAGGEAARRTETARSILEGVSPEDGANAPRSTDIGSMAGTDTTSSYPNEGFMPTSNIGGLGGLGGYEEEPATGGIAGFLENPGVNDVLQAVSLSLMSSPRNNWLQNVGTYLPEIQQRREKKDERQTQQQAMVAALMRNGFSADEARAYATSPQAATLAVAGRDDERALVKENQTLKVLRRQYPEIANQVEAGLPISEALKMAAEERAASRKAPDFETYYDPETGLERKGYWNPSTKSMVPVGGTKAGSVSGGGGKYGLQAVPVLKRDGSYGFIQLGEDGTINEPKLPEGVRPYNPYELSQQKAKGAAEGTAIGQASAALPGAAGTAARVSAQIESLKNDAYLPDMVGPFDSRLGNWSGDAARVQSKMDQLQGGAFLEARQMLKGGGAITDMEGGRAEDAFARLNAAQSEADYIKALNEFDEAVQTGLAKLQQQAGSGTQMPGVDGSSPANNTDYRSKYGLE